MPSFSLQFSFCFVFHSKLLVRDGQESNLEGSSFLILKHVSMCFTPSIEKLFGKKKKKTFLDSHQSREICMTVTTGINIRKTGTKCEKLLKGKCEVDIH